MARPAADRDERAHAQAAGRPGTAGDLPGWRCAAPPASSTPAGSGPQLEQAYSQIREAALADTKKQVTNDKFELGVGGLRGIIAAREHDILAQIPAQ